MSPTSAESGSVGTKLALAARPFAYDSGYGDFCFLRLVDRYPKPPMGVVDPDFIRLGTFPFMRLPRELRDKIYEYMLAPLLSKHAFIKGDRRNLVLLVNHSEDEYYNTKAHRARWVLDLHSQSMESEVKKAIEDEQKKVAEMCERFFPPNRAKYEITVPLFFGTAKKHVWSGSEKIQPVSIACIRNLSNVSSQIREEFGICAWNGSLLNINYGSYVEGLACLKERPAIWRGLKAMCIHFRDIGEDDILQCLLECPSCEHTCSGGLLSMIDFMDQHLQLDVLMFKLDMLPDLIEKVLKSAVKPRWVDALRGLRCAKDIQFEIRVCDGTFDEGDYDEDQMDTLAEELEELLRPLILAGSDEELLGEAFPTFMDLEFSDRVKPDGSTESVYRDVNEREFLFDEYSWCHAEPAPSDSSDDDVDGDDELY